MQLGQILKAVLQEGYNFKVYELSLKKMKMTSAH